MGTPFEYITGTISIANGIFTLATNFYKLKNVDDDLKVCLRLLVMINEDLNTARRLRSRKYAHIKPEITDSLHDRADRAIKDLDIAATKIGKSIEAVRVEKSVDNSISIAKRFKWVFNGKDNFIAQQWVVNAAHIRVLSVITSMESLPDVQGEMLAPPPTYEEALLRSPSQLRALKGKSTAIVGGGKISEEAIASGPEPIALDPQLPSRRRSSSSLSTSRTPYHRRSSSLLSTSRSFLSEDYTEEDVMNEKILARWNSKKRERVV